jgi:hypothetical protein
VKFLQRILSPISLPCGFGGGGLDIITIVSFKLSRPLRTFDVELF